MSADAEHLRAVRPALELRARLMRALRTFFADRGFLEIETPVRLRAPAPELHIDAEPSGDAWLRTSPELHMKRLLAAGYERIFQVGPCFRRGEFGARHRPEYAMLEWYRAGADYHDVLVDTKALVLGLAREVLGTTRLRRGGREVTLEPAWAYLTVSEAFIGFAGWDPVERFDPDRFDLDLVDKVEPQLPREVPVVLADYPAPAAALARRKPGRPAVAERWELYLDGIEIANAYSELTDPVEQAARFEEWNRARAAAGKPVYPPDREFLAALEKGLPACAGVALGVDRLAMLFAGAESLDEVLPFHEGA
ncbi:MAG TPA: EF-P lysine aminoacylase EpmA [Kiritimatiellia bacterium]|nr:EF-P lysine aminoacylase EpmA [Kiritimatiellia bacterium]HRZ12126.1 EF-P lysine aminoacylase EpmA [Kiritimatiellia bacterium]HSA18116.1 EF-P lysine aminoacylase EpmA [Kiritimatiellia bacterium]